MGKKIQISINYNSIETLNFDNNQLKLQNYRLQSLQLKNIIITNLAAQIEQPTQMQNYPHHQNKIHQKQNNHLNKTNQISKNNLTSDLTNILKQINTNTGNNVQTNNISWKNKSDKFSKNVLQPQVGKDKNMMQNQTMKNNQNNQMKNNVMTEDDIDRLFQKSKSKTKTETEQQGVTKLEDCWDVSNRDFIKNVHFLKMDDEHDRLLDGLPSPNQFYQTNKPFSNTIEHINLLFSNDNTEDTNDKLHVDLTSQFKKDYLVGKIIGEGAYASVRVAVYKAIQKKVAIKVYEKHKIKDYQRKKSVRREIKILQMLQHQNIVKIYDVVETNNHLNIVMEYLSGISLHSYLKVQANQRANEKQSKLIVYQLSSALKYLHARQISHRDIKLQNVILNDSLAPKLIDFGFSTCIQKHKKVKIFCGTPSYMAPEIVQKKQYRGEPADIWALGVLFFVTITGIFPFKGATDQQLYKKINNSEYPKNQLFFSKDILDLISKMLKINPDQRITAPEILVHPWFANDSNYSDQFKKDKRHTEVSECRKRTTISSHKSKEKEQMNTNARKLTETCHENLNYELKIIKQSQSPIKLNSTLTQRKCQKEILKANINQKDNRIMVIKEKEKLIRSSNVESMKLQNKKDMLNKTNKKMLELLKMGLKKKQEQKQKSKSKSKRV